MCDIGGIPCAVSVSLHAADIENPFFCVMKLNKVIRMMRYQRQRLKSTWNSTKWYPSLMDSGIMNSTRAHQARVLNGQIFFFLIKLSILSGHVGLKNMVQLEYHKKWYITIFFQNSVSGQNISRIDRIWPFWPTHLR